VSISFIMITLTVILTTCRTGIYLQHQWHIMWHHRTV